MSAAETAETSSGEATVVSTGVGLLPESSLQFSDHEGVAVAHDPALGRILIATRPFSMGEDILVEEPLLAWKSTSESISFDAYVRGFFGLPADKQDVLLDMAHPRLSMHHPRVDASRVEAGRLALSPAISPFLRLFEESRFSGEDPVALLHKLLLIRDTNCHAYSAGEKQTETSFVGPLGARAPIKQAALFHLASKVAHSCDPNSFYTSKRGAKLRYVASRPIAAGEMITFSYLGDLATTPRAERRKELWRTKAFHCFCKRCAGVDDCRGLYCPAKTCGGVAFELDSGGWACNKCGVRHGDADMKAALGEETRLQATIAAVDARLIAGAMPPAGPLTFEQLSADIASRLSPAHYLATQAQALQIKWQAGQRDSIKQACMMFRQPALPAPWNPRLRINSAWASLGAGMAGARALTLMQCSVNKCSGGITCTTIHPPYPCAVAEALWTSSDILDGIEGGAADPGGVALTTAVRVARSYLPIFRGHYPADDTDLMRLEKLVREKGSKVADGPLLEPAARRFGDAGSGHRKGASGAVGTGGSAGTAAAADDGEDTTFSAVPKKEEKKRAKKRAQKKQTKTKKRGAAAAAGKEELHEDEESESEAGQGDEGEGDEGEGGKPGEE